MRSRWQSGSARALGGRCRRWGDVAPRLRPLVAKPPGSRGEGTSAWILAAMHGSLYVALSASLVLANKHLVVNTRHPDPHRVARFALRNDRRVDARGVRARGAQDAAHDVAVGDVRPAHRGDAAVALAFANLALTFVSLSLAQMAKAFAPAVTAAALVTLRLDRAFDDKCARAVCVIVGGCVVAAWGATATGNEPRAWIGLGCMVACEVAEALRLCGVQYLLSSSSNRNDDATVGNNTTTRGSIRRPPTTGGPTNPPTKA